MADEDEGSGLGSRLKAKAGPLPVWGWAVIIAVGVGLYLHYKKSKSNADTSTDTSQTSSGSDENVSDYAAGIIGADYDLRNQLNTTNSDIAQLASGVNTNTAAVSANTAAEKEEEKPSASKDKYALVRYYNHAYEVGPHSGVDLSQAWIKKMGGLTHFEKGTEYVQFGDTYYKLGSTTPTPITKDAFSKIHGHPKATVLSPNTNVNVAPSKVR